MFQAALLAQLVSPGTGSLGHGAGAEAETPAAFAVLGDQAVHPLAVATELDHAHAIERLAALGPRLAQHTHHQARVVGDRIGEQGAA